MKTRRTEVASATVNLSAPLYIANKIPITGCRYINIPTVDAFKFFSAYKFNK